MSTADITSAANPRFKLARALLTRRGRQQQHRLLLEGVRLIEDSTSAGYPPALVLFDPAAAGTLAPVLARARQAGAETLALEAPLMAQLVSTVTPQGVVAVAPWPEVKVVRKGGLSLIVDGLQDPGNLGTLLRSAAAAGVDQVILLPGVTDPWAPKVMRAGMGAHYRVAIRQGRDLAQASEWLGTCQLFLADASAPVSYAAVDWTPPSALIVGGEAHGAAAARHWPGVRTVAIPMSAQVESLNAAVAASVILFEALRQRRQPRPS